MALDLSTISSGTYSPSVAGKTGTLASSTITVATAQYMRVGKTVTVSGKFTTAAGGGGDGAFTLSLPITTAFSSAEQCGGVLQPDAGNPSSVGYGIKAVASSSTVRLGANFGSVSTFDWYFNFVYQIL